MIYKRINNKLNLFPYKYLNHNLLRLTPRFAFYPGGFLFSFPQRLLFLILNNFKELILSDTYLCCMKVPSNKIGDIRSYYAQQLFKFYDERETEIFIFMLIEEYTGILKLDIFMNPEKTINE